MEEIVVHEYATFWTENTGIIYCELYNTDFRNKLDKRTAQIYLKAIKQLSKGTPMPLYIDLRKAKGTFTIEAAQVLSKELGSSTLINCEAFVVQSLSIHVLVQAYKRIFKTTVPYGIFKSALKAQEFCDGFKAVPQQTTV